MNDTETREAAACAAAIDMIIRPEKPSDAAAIRALTEAAFAPMPFSDGTEASMPDQLRADGDLTLSLVAQDEGGDVVGHVAISPVTIRGLSDWYGLGPISVRADRQRRGIGSAMTAQALSRLRRNGARGLALIGNPEVYAPMGFVSNGRLTYRDLSPALVQYAALSGDEPSGELRFAAALEGSA